MILHPKIASSSKENQRILIFISHDVYYWEPFYNDLVEDKKVAIIVAENRAENLYSKNFCTEIQNAETHVCDKIYLSNKKLLKYFKTFLMLWQFRKKSVLITEYTKIFNWYTVIIAWIFGCKVFFKGETILLPDEKINIFKKMYLKYFLFFVDEIFYSCTYNLKLFQSINPRKKMTPIWCFCNNISERWKKTSGQFFMEENLNVVLCGAFTKTKNFEIIIPILEADLRLRQRVHIHLIGSGNTLANIEDNLIKLKVKYTKYGYISPSDVPEILFKYGDILFLPSIRDNSPKVVNEAMTVGMPILASKNCGTAPDLVYENCNGFTFYPNDKNQIAKCLNIFLDNTHLLHEFGRNSTRIVRSFSAAEAVKSLMGRI